MNVVSSGRLLELLRDGYNYVPCIDLDLAGVGRDLVPSTRTRTADEIHPRFRRDTTFVSSRDGVLLRSDHRFLFLKGESLYDVLRELESLLTGEYTLAQLSDNLPQPQQRNLHSLILLLLESGFLEDYAGLAPSFPADKSREMARSFEFLKRTADNPETALLTFCNSRILVIGSGTAADSCKRALCSFGLPAVSSMDYGSAFRRTASPIAASAGNGAGGNSITTARLEMFNLICCCIDDPMMADLVAMVQAGNSACRPLLIGAAMGSCSLLGPFVPANSSSCWVCGIIRILDSLDGGDAAAVRAWHRGTPAPPCNTLLESLGKDTALEAFKYLTGGTRMQTRDSVLVTSLQGNGATWKTVVPDPLAACHGYCARAYRDEASLTNPRASWQDF
jgi:hypothetical protein